MSGAILQAQTRPARTPAGASSTSTCPGACQLRSRNDRVAMVLVETGMAEVLEQVTTIRLGTPAGLVIAWVAVSDPHLDSVTHRRSSVFVFGWMTRSRCPGTARCRTASPSVETSMRWPTWTRSSRRTRHGTRKSTASTTATMLNSLRLFDCPALAARDGDLPELVRPIPARHGNLCADGGTVGTRRTRFRP